MQIILDFLVIILSSIIALNTIIKIIKGNYSALHFITIIFYIFQIIPIFVSYFGDLTYIKRYYPYMYLAMTDSKVNIVYDIIVTLFIVVLYISANKFFKSSKNKIQEVLNANIFKKLKKFKIILIILFISLFIAIMLSPDPKIYLKFSYFYTHNYNVNDDIYIYYKSVISPLVNFIFFFIILCYAAKTKKSNLLFYLDVFILTWINGKRTLLTFLLVGMLVIDFFKCDKSSKKEVKNLITKSITYGIIIISYFVVYNKITQKASFADWYLQYTTYFSRMCNVKVAIYDMLKDKIMLKYYGESILYNIFFFIPRSIWESKPYPYYRYFTSYVFNGSYNSMIGSSNFQVNLLSEFISNFGIVAGALFSLIFILKVVKISENSTNKIIYFSGIGFITIYMMYGFENIVRYIFFIWVVLNICNFFFKRLKK